MLGQSSRAWEKLTGHIRFFYAMDEVWDEGNPAHKHYNTLRFRRGGKTLITLCVRDGYFMVCVVLGKDERERFDEQREKFGEAVCKTYDQEDVLHDGKWIAFDIRDESLIDDIIRLLHIKRKPNRKVFPENPEKCGRCNIGLSHEGVTEFIFS